MRTISNRRWVIILNNLSLSYQIYHPKNTTDWKTCSSWTSLRIWSKNFIYNVTTKSRLSTERIFKAPQSNLSVTSQSAQIILFINFWIILEALRTFTSANIKTATKCSWTSISWTITCAHTPKRSHTPVTKAAAVVSAKSEIATNIARSALAESILLF